MRVRFVLTGRGFLFLTPALALCLLALLGPAQAERNERPLGLLITVNSIRTYASLTDEFGERIAPLRGVFVGANVSIHNQGDKSLQLDASMFRIKDEQGESFSASPYSEKRLFSRALPAGESVQGALFFDCPSETSGLSLVFVQTKPVGGPLLAELALTNKNAGKRPAIPDELLGPGGRMALERTGAVARYAAAAGPHEAGRFVFVIKDAEVRRTQRELGRKRPRTVQTTLVAVGFAAQNAQSSAQRLEPGMFRLRDAGGRDYPAHFYTDKSVFETEIAPGATFQGELVFEAPPQARGLTLALDAGVEKLVEIVPTDYVRE